MSTSATKPPTRHARDVIGVTHALGTYHLTGKDYLNEGADAVLALGSRVIKFYLTYRKEAKGEAYPFNSKWGKVASLVELAQTPCFQDALRKPFSTVVFTTYSIGHGDYQYWRKGISDEDAAEETRQFYELTKYLLETFKGTGKTFVLQNWEGDWGVSGATDPKRDVSQDAFDAMIKWLGARQAGVSKARAEAGKSDVRVYNAAEVNLVLPSIRGGRPSVTTHVLPHIKPDLVSYSCWEAQEDPKLLAEALDFIAGHTAYSEPFGHKNVYVGEFGRPEFEGPRDLVKKVLDTVLSTGAQWGCPYMIYWQLYCNEAKRRPVKTNEDVRGFCLIRPDGKRNEAWTYLARVMKTDRL